MNKLSISNLAWNEENTEAVYALMKKYGFSGLEIAPTKIFPEKPYSHISEAASWARNLFEKYGFIISSMQSIWYGRTEKLFGTEDERIALLDYTKRAIDFAAAVGCKNLVFGCPKNRNIDTGSDEQIAVRFFKELGDYAASKNTCIGMEANPAIYGTNFINTTKSAIEFIRLVGSNGFRLNLDAGTMIENSESVSILHENADVLNHVHISEPYLKKIQSRGLHNELISFLLDVDYKGFVSIEMGLQEKITDIEEVMKYVATLMK